MTTSPERPCEHLWRKPAHTLALGFGAGCARRAPGTAGTVVAIPLYLLMQGLPVPVYLLLTVGLFGLGVLVCDLTARDLGVHDHPSIVWDEIVGYLIAMAAAPPGWLWIVIGFAAFRFFDILKPWPVSVADRRMSGGFGIMVDDVLAGIYAWLMLQLLVLVLA